MRFFNPERFYKPVPVEFPLPLPSGIAVRVHFKFMYKTPEGTERVFPKGFPFILKFGDGTTEGQTIKKRTGRYFYKFFVKKNLLQLNLNLPKQILLLRRKMIL